MIKWIKDLRQASAFAEVDSVRVDLRKVKTIRDIKDILVIMATPNASVVLCNVGNVSKAKDRMRMDDD